MTAHELRTWLVHLAEAEATVPARVVLERLPGDEPTPTGPTPEPEPATWREKVWTVPAETRLGKHELLEALGKSESWLYHRTGPRADNRIPHRKLDGVLVFTAGEIRTWIREAEEVMHGLPMERAGPEVVR